MQIKYMKKTSPLYSTYRGLGDCHSQKKEKGEQQRLLPTCAHTSPRRASSLLLRRDAPLPPPLLPPARSERKKKEGGEACYWEGYYHDGARGEAGEASSPESRIRTERRALGRARPPRARPQMEVAVDARTHTPAHGYTHTRTHTHSRTHTHTTIIPPHKPCTHDDGRCIFPL